MDDSHTQRHYHCKSHQYLQLVRSLVAGALGVFIAARDAGARESKVEGVDGGGDVVDEDYDIEDDVDGEGEEDFAHAKAD